MQREGDGEGERMVLGEPEKSGREDGSIIKKESLEECRKEPWRDSLWVGCQGEIKTTVHSCKNMLTLKHSFQIMSTKIYDHRVCIYPSHVNIFHSLSPAYRFINIYLSLFLIYLSINVHYPLYRSQLIISLFVPDLSQFVHNLFQCLLSISVCSISIYINSLS